MKKHWSHTYHLDLEGDKIHEVILYRFSSKVLLMTAPTKFNNAFGKYLEEIGGSWNDSLKCEEYPHPISGWLFPLEIQENLIGLLGSIHKGDIEPRKVAKSTVDCNKLYAQLEKVFEMIPQTNEISVMEIPGGETIFVFNRPSDEIVRGECVLTLEKSRKKLEIYQHAN